MWLFYNCAFDFHIKLHLCYSVYCEVHEKIKTNKKIMSKDDEDNLTVNTEKIKHKNITQQMIIDNRL